MSPYDTDLPIHSVEDALFSSHLNQPKELSTDFSSVDLGFLPDDINQENEEQIFSEDGHETKEDKNVLPAEEQGSGIVMDESNLPQVGCTSVTQPSPDTSGVYPPLTPMTPMTPMTPVSESSGIVPQLQ